MDIPFACQWSSITFTTICRMLTYICICIYVVDGSLWIFIYIFWASYKISYNSLLRQIHLDVCFFDKIIIGWLVMPDYYHLISKLNYKREPLHFSGLVTIFHFHSLNVEMWENFLNEKIWLFESNVLTYMWFMLEMRIYLTRK